MVVGLLEDEDEDEGNEDEDDEDEDEDEEDEELPLVLLLLLVLCLERPLSSLFFSTVLVEEDGGVSLSITTTLLPLLLEV